MIPLSVLLFRTYFFSTKILRRGIHITKSFRKQYFKPFNATTCRTDATINKESTTRSGMNNLDTPNKSSPEYNDFSSFFGDEETERQIKLILLEYEYAKISGFEVPNQIPLSDMQELLNCKSFYERLECFATLCGYQEYRMKFKRKKLKEVSTTEWENKRTILLDSAEKSNHILYGTDNVLHDNVDFYLFYETRLAKATQFGQPLVFDFRYDNFMDIKLCARTGHYIYKAYNRNRFHCEPFNIHFCNIGQTNFEGSTIMCLKKLLRYSFGDNAMVTESNDSYLKVFERKKCIYLTPSAKESMEFFDHEAIYIIGAYMDYKNSVKPVTLEKARNDGVKCLKLPIDKYSKFGMSFTRARTLPFHIIISVLLEMKTSGDWNKISSLLPKSKHFSRTSQMDHWNCEEDENQENYLIPRTAINRYKKNLKDAW